MVKLRKLIGKGKLTGKLFNKLTIMDRLFEL